MAGPAALRAALDRAAAHGVTRPGCPLTGAATARRFLCTQIEMTRLPRRLTFLMDDVPRLWCDVAGGRLLAFGTPEDDRTASRLDDPEAVSQLSEALQDLAGRLDRAAKGANRITLRTAPLPAPAPTASGVPAERVAQALGLSLVPLQPEEFLDLFLQQAGPALRAAAQLSEDMLYPLTEEGTEMEYLAEMIETVLPDLDTLPDGPGLPRAGDRLLILSPEGADLLLQLSCSGAQVFALAQPGSEMLLLDSWHRAREPT
ncbi:hypothetical protein [Pseudoponticoccus marisrubri]|uniref:Uncharacterized protein n=1 Tax=Pseudoponticoccus marisrubri TaxID=1685382 RepID=A0A0W7WKM6_9RHOB|nr:hypothetical protein [Pseudoponticoccus marisrubri]KUF11089.1 hypothetical protein AVJ23_08505 [Pseudoponticoccus marisrubri]